MGLFDSIKKAANFITGNSADVRIYLNPDVDTKINGSLPLVIKVRVKDSEINMNHLYLKVRASEYVDVSKVEYEMEDGELERDVETIRKSTETYKNSYEVTGMQTLEANTEYTFEYDCPIPHNVPLTYRGVHARHEWEFYAGVDCAGNDPDSGWNAIEIR
ncbi:sporulation protein [Aureivirga sp. CE67]|uniref:sporulation protein n=1 Tax=Aureivirga sp. CE67 TaxID=1788983 RepID=UPI0018C9944C|nr:sporulation protein [Aureivirga sp. CE67]